MGAYTGETLVLAGPGSGKTYVLTAHIETLIERYHVDPSSILVLTFSKAAALSMRARFYKNTKGRYPPIAFGTFHSIFYQMIRSSGNDHMALIDAARRYRLLQALLREFFPEITDPDNVDVLSGVICRSREQAKPCPRGDFKRPEAIALAVRAYENYLAENHLIDFDGMILLCRELLCKDPQLLRNMQQQYSFLLVDEFQDISASQYSILRLLYDRAETHLHGTTAQAGRSASMGRPGPIGRSGPVDRSDPALSPCGLFVVGDDDQSIYGFRGSDPAICRQFLEDYPSARQILLTTNYRSVSPIVQTAGTVIAQNQNRIAKDIVSGKASTTAHGPGKKEPNIRRPRAVACKSFIDRKEQSDYLVKVVSAMEERTRRESAIICRTNRQLRFFQQALARAGLLPSTLAIPENPWIARVHTLYQAYMTFGREIRGDAISRETYVQIMNVPERFLLRESMPQDHVTRRVFLSIYPQGSRPWSAMANLVENAERLMELPERLRVRYFRHVIGIEADLMQRANGDEGMCEQIREAFEELAAHPDKAIPDIPAREASRDRQVNHDVMNSTIHLMTMHACKGLEYDNVYLPDLNEGMIPIRRANTSDAIEEERRLFYVAMTRAREHLELLYVKGNCENPATPTRFLLPLGIGPDYSQS